MDVNDYDPRMFVLSVASCNGAMCSGSDIDTKVAEAIDAALQTKGWNTRDWKVVWGPGISVMQPVFSDPPPDKPQVYPSDVMFVARNSSSYFVSVAATNYLSIFDVGEDFKAQTMRYWPYAASGRESAGKISRGFHESLRILQRMKPAKGLPGADLTLREFLRHVVRRHDGDINIITGGHSQGGATAPLVALWLSDTQGEWNAEGKAKISCYRSAGPTPGDCDFATYYDGQVPATVSLVNPKDFVPKIFVEREMLKIPLIYEPFLQPTREIEQLVVEMAALGATGRYRQIAYGEEQLVELQCARVNMHIYGADPSATDCQKFARQMGYQHAQAYFELLGLNSDIPLAQFDGLCGS